MNDEILSLLLKGRERVKSGWAIENYAEDKYGNSVLSDNPIAVKWCPIGAISADNYRDKVKRNAMKVMCKFMDVEIMDIDITGDLYSEIIITWNQNPDRTQEEVIAMFDRAIDELIVKV